MRNAADADDVLQEVFIKVHQKLDSLRDTDDLGPWLYRVTRNQLLDFYRGRNRRKEVEHFASQNPEEQQEDFHELLECLTGMVSTLPKKYRDALLLADHKGMPQQAVADQLQLSLSATKSRIQRGRQMVRKQLLHCCRVALTENGVITGNYNRSTCADCD